MCACVCVCVPRIRFFIFEVASVHAQCFDGELNGHQRAKKKKDNIWNVLSSSSLFSPSLWEDVALLPSSVIPWIFLWLRHKKKDWSVWSLNITVRLCGKVWDNTLTAGVSTPTLCQFCLFALLCTYTRYVPFVFLQWEAKSLKHAKTDFTLL